jgi:hypothetical protein
MKGCLNIITGFSSLNIILVDTAPPGDRRGEISIRFGHPANRQPFKITTLGSSDDDQSIVRLHGQFNSNSLQRSNFGTYEIWITPTGQREVDLLRTQFVPQRYMLFSELLNNRLSTYQAESWVYVSLGLEVFFVDYQNSGEYQDPVPISMENVRDAVLQTTVHPSRMLRDELIKSRIFINSLRELVRYPFNIV